MTVASAWVIGEITDRVLLPAFADGATTAAALALAAAAIIGVAVLKIVGILGRRLFAGIMSYRLQADYRRRVTRQYLRLPLSWHQRHPTGQLLSNANSDVEAAWFFVAPLPFAVRRAGHDRDHASSRCSLTDPLLALVGLVVFPAVFAVNVVYSQVMSPAHAAGPAAARRGQRDRARELRRRAGGQDPGPRGRRDRPVRRPGRRAARRR